MTRGLKFSTTTSAFVASFRAISRPELLLRSRVTPRLLVFRYRNGRLISGWGRVADERTHAARGVAAAGPLDFHDVGAEVGKQLGAVRPGHVVCKVQHANAVERGLIHGEECSPGLVYNPAHGPQRGAVRKGRLEYIAQFGDTTSCPGS